MIHRTCARVSNGAIGQNTPQACNSPLNTLHQLTKAPCKHVAFATCLRLIKPHQRYCVDIADHNHVPGQPLTILLSEITLSTFSDALHRVAVLALKLASV